MLQSPGRRRAASAQEAVDSHRAGDGGELFGITELCAEFGITLRTIRFYEDKGLLAPRRVNGARVYTRRDRARLALILRGKAMGMSLTEIRHILDLYGDHGEGKVKQLEYIVGRIDESIAGRRLHAHRPARAQRRPRRALHPPWPTTSATSSPTTSSTAASPASACCVSCPPAAAPRP